MSTRYIIQCADTGPFDSLAHMVRSIGGEVAHPSVKLRLELSRLGGLVLSNEFLQRTMGYESLSDHLGVDEIRPGDVLLDVKAHQTYDKLVARWPHLAGRVGWYRINGGQPEHVTKPCGACPIPGVMTDGAGGSRRPCPHCKGTGIKEDCGDEVNPPCPVITPNQWYGHPSLWQSRFYTFWPTLMDKKRYSRIWAESPDNFSAPISLIHNVHGWGYGTVINDCIKMGVKVYGRGSPAGLIQHAAVPYQLRSALAMVHLKTSDAPGYALLEAIAAECPIVLSRRLIQRCQMAALFEPAANCLTFDDYERDAPWDECATEIRACLNVLKTDVKIGRRLGMALRDRYAELEWDAKRDASGFKSFLQRVGLS